MSIFDIFTDPYEHPQPARRTGHNSRARSPRREEVTKEDILLIRGRISGLEGEIDSLREENQKLKTALSHVERREKKLAEYLHLKLEASKSKRRGLQVDFSPLNGWAILFALVMFGLASKVRGEGRILMFFLIFQSALLHLATQARLEALIAFAGEQWPDLAVPDTLFGERPPSPAPIVIFLRLGWWALSLLLTCFLALLDRVMRTVLSFVASAAALILFARHGDKILFKANQIFGKNARKESETPSFDFHFFSMLKSSSTLLNLLGSFNSNVLPAAPSPLEEGTSRVEELEEEEEEDMREEEGKEDQGKEE